MRGSSNNKEGGDEAVTAQSSCGCSFSLGKDQVEFRTTSQGSNMSGSNSDIPRIECTSRNDLLGSTHW